MHPQNTTHCTVPFCRRAIRKTVYSTLCSSEDDGPRWWHIPVRSGIQRWAYTYVPAILTCGGGSHGGAIDAPLKGSCSYQSIEHGSVRSIPLFPPIWGGGGRITSPWIDLVEIDRPRTPLQSHMQVMYVAILRTCDVVAFERKSNLRVVNQSSVSVWWRVCDQSSDGRVHCPVGWNRDSSSVYGVSMAVFRR